MEKMGVPEGIIRAYKHLYTGNAHRIRLGGECWQSVTVSSGVRQGCPISPLFFLLVVEQLLRKLQRITDANKYRAYADDIGAVVRNLRHDLPPIIDVFDQCRWNGILQFANGTFAWNFR